RLDTRWALVAAAEVALDGDLFVPPPRRPRGRGERARRHLDVVPGARLGARPAARAELLPDEDLAAGVAPDGARRAAHHARWVLAVLAGVGEHQVLRRARLPVPVDARHDLVPAPDEAGHAVHLRARPGAVAAAHAALEVDHEQRARHLEAVQVAEDVLRRVRRRPCYDGPLRRLLVRGDAAQAGQERGVARGEVADDARRHREQEGGPARHGARLAGAPLLDL